MSGSIPDTSGLLVCTMLRDMRRGSFSLRPVGALGPKACPVGPPMFGSAGDDRRSNVGSVGALALNWRVTCFFVGGERLGLGCSDDRPDAGSDDPDAGARADERAGTHRVDLDGTRPRALRNADRDDSPHVAQPQPVRYDGDG